MKTKKAACDTELTRRQFLRGTALSAAAFMVVPGGVLGLRGAASANQKLNLAGIGIGGQGASDLGQMESENIVALCDWIRTTPPTPSRSTPRRSSSPITGRCSTR